MPGEFTLRVDEAGGWENGINLDAHTDIATIANKTRDLAGAVKHFNNKFWGILSVLYWSSHITWITKRLVGHEIVTVIFRGSFSLNVYINA